MNSIPSETAILLFERTDPFFDSVSPKLPAAGRLGSVTHTVELLARGEDSLAPLEDCDRIDRLTDPSLLAVPLARAERERRKQTERFISILS